jgi:hypothetical protein
MDFTTFVCPHFQYLLCVVECKMHCAEFVFAVTVSEIEPSSQAGEWHIFRSLAEKKNTPYRSGTDEIESAGYKNTL